MTSRTNPTCFISYCREGADKNSILHFVQEIKDASGGNLEILFDEELKPGADLDKFMSMLNQVDGVILLLTPQYKERVEERRGGVYTEFSTIIKRHLEETERANRKVHENNNDTNLITSPFCLIPVIFSANFDRSCPREIESKLALDFSEYRAHSRKNGNLYVTGDTRRRYQRKIKKIVSEISAGFVASTDTFRMSFEEILDSFFKTTKHEEIRDNPMLSTLVQSIFVKTHAYKQVKTQASYLLVGRKGSGKSTITHQLAERSHGKYKKHVEINVNNFDLEFLYTFLHSSHNGIEQSVTINQINSFEVAWELFLYICCMEAVVAEHQEGKLCREQERMMPIIVNYLSLVVGSDALQNDIRHKALYRWCYSRIFETKEEIIREARSGLSGFSYDMAVALDNESLIVRILTEDVLRSFEKVLRMCKRRFLVSLDGFDTAFDEFRVGSRYARANIHDSSERVQFELDWLRGFLHVMLRLKSSRNNVPLGNLIDFCAMIPKDRFMEIRGNERDAYVYISKYHDIRWSGIELAIMLRKRLEVLGHHLTNKSERPHERLDNVLQEKFPCVPPQATITVAGKDYVMPVFIAVLRHTFWRPREILIYFAKIISVVRDFRKRKMEINNFTISKCISDTTREIISAEFINEFQRHCTNLSDILSRFRRKSQILSIEDAAAALADLPFVFVDDTEPEYSFQEKVRFLYEIGFLGLEASPAVARRLKLLHRDAFWFNAGDEPLSMMEKEQFEGCRFVIHPIFCEYLDLDTSANQRLTIDFGWDYLEQQEAHMMI